MIKSMLLVGAAMIAAPALAQTAKPAGDAAPGRTPMTATPADTPQTTATDTVQAPVPAAPATGTTPTDPVQAAQQSPAGQAMPAQPQTTGDAMAQAPAAPAAPAQPATTGTQVSSIIDGEFPTYDKDGDGKLSRTEFGAWMVALKTKSDPSTKADAPATKTWVAGAFTSADKDKSASISKTELTGYLSQGQS